MITYDKERVLEVSYCVQNPNAVRLFIIRVIFYLQWQAVKLNLCLSLYTFRVQQATTCK